MKKEVAAGPGPGATAEPAQRSSAPPEERPRSSAPPPKERGRRSCTEPSKGAAWKKVKRRRVAEVEPERDDEDYEEGYSDYREEYGMEEALFGPNDEVRY